MIRTFLFTAIVPVLASCSGYQLGHAKPTHLSAIQSINVPLVKNNTQEPRLAALTTNAIVDAIARDGTYRILSGTSADTTLEATITRTDYEEYRSRRIDTLYPEDLIVNVIIQWSLMQNGVQIESGKAIGTSKLSIGDNQQRARENAFPDAVKDAAQDIVSKIANGF